MKIVYQGKTKKGKDILVRYPEMGDLEKLLNFINEISDERTFIRYQGEHETKESEEKWLKGRLEEIDNKKTVHLLAFSDNKLAGATEIHLKDKTEQHIGVFGITVAKTFRGEGVGKTLIDLIIKEAVKELSGLRMITLEVYSTNDIAKDLYKKLGFIEYGLLPNGIVRDGRFEDAILMYKNI
ncbi:MAG TPA: GNAT family N-acetyltransferase [Patescibacteria group bacterium]|nr:GNAT family N-acetyltransferase [Patescibacteria group bacterium]